jgi:hypothetical protein
LPICFDLTVEDSAHFVRNHVSVLDAAVSDASGQVQGIQEGLASIFSDTVTGHIEMSESVVTFADELSKAFSSIITDNISAEVKANNHLPLGEELAKLLNMLISEVLIHDVNNVGLEDAPRFKGRLEALSHLSIFVEANLLEDLHINDRGIHLSGGLAHCCTFWINVGWHCELRDLLNT